MLTSEQIQPSFDHSGAFRASQVHISSHTLSSLKALRLVHSLPECTSCHRKNGIFKRKGHRRGQQWGEHATLPLKMLHWQCFLAARERHVAPRGAPFSSAPVWAAGGGDLEFQRSNKDNKGLKFHFNYIEFCAPPHTGVAFSCPVCSGAHLAIEHFLKSDLKPLWNGIWQLLVLGVITSLEFRLGWAGNRAPDPIAMVPEKPMM